MFVFGEVSGDCFLLFQVHVLVCFFVFGCQMRGKVRLQSDLFCVVWDVKPD